MNSEQLSASLDAMLKRSIVTAMSEVLHGLHELSSDPAALDAATKVKEAAALLAGLQPTLDKSAISDGYHTFAELYEHRHALFLQLMCWAPEPAEPWWSYQHEEGGEPMHENSIIAGMMTPNGPISYHLPDSYADILAALPMVQRLEFAKPWDGHSSTDVVQRLLDTVKDTGGMDL